ncbi:hypothetical protein LCGC14_2162160 [marine sediment metagenome]|uniref:Uncharacterized protein n=1 Tax=marine sediment metagenome TaxID=412755 RepID=A0A0F9GNK3_9ZZZZ
MPNISEMTDDVLNRAIAEELGWQHSSKSVAIETAAWPYKWLSPKGVGADPPNYSGNIAAAFNLPLETNDEKRKFAIELAKIVIPDINIGTAGIVYEAAVATARQRSEAWYSARSEM